MPERKLYHVIVGDGFDSETIEKLKSVVLRSPFAAPSNRFIVIPDDAAEEVFGALVGDGKRVRLYSSTDVFETLHKGRADAVPGRLRTSPTHAGVPRAASVAPLS